MILAPGNTIAGLYDEDGDIRMDVLYMTRQQREREAPPPSVQAGGEGR